MSERIGTYADFWPVYLARHSRPGTRVLHYLGTATGFCFLVALTVTGDIRLLAAAVIGGYGLAWAGHAFIERNRPATFRHPLWSLISDIRMLALLLAGRMGDELKTHGIG